MKKILLIIGLFLLFSCEKEQEPVFCWYCEKTTTYKATRYNDKVESEVIVKCDMTATEIGQFEKDESSFIVIKIGSTTASTEIIMECVKR